jgi:phosphate uptake regulator
MMTSKGGKEPHGSKETAEAKAAAGPERTVETRKIQRSGRGSTVLSLPKEWVDRVGLKPGDPVALYFQPDGSFVLSPRLIEASSRVKATLEIDPKRPARTTRQIIAAYLEGCGQIELRAKTEITPQMRQTIHDGVRKIVGLEVVDEGRDRIVLLDVASPSDFPMGRGLRRMHMLTRAMHEDAVAALVEGQGERSGAVLSRDDEVDRLYWLIFKQHHLILRDPRFAAKLETTPQKSLGVMLAARILERVSDHACTIANSASDLRGSLPKSIADGLNEASKQAVTLLDRAFQCFVGEDSHEAHEVIESVKPFEARVSALRESIGGLKGRQAVALAYVLESIERTGAYATDLAELAVNNAVRTQ